MKQLVLLLALMISATGFSQVKDNWEDISEKLPGYVITNKGEKIEGYLKRFLKIKSQRKVKFFKTLEDKPVVYNAKQLKAYQIEIILDFDGTKIQTEILAVKDGKEYLKFASPKLLFSFKKVMSKYLADYPELAKKVKDKEKGYRILAVLKIIKEYNAHFAK